MTPLTSLLGKEYYSHMGLKKEKNNQVLEIFRAVGAIITNSHIVLTSGKHSSVYLNKDAVYPHTKEISRICRLMAQKYRGRKMEVVVGPALGGIILSQWVAYHLSRLEKREVLGVYTEKTANGSQIFRRRYGEFVPGKRVLVVEDLTTTGGSVKQLVERVREHRGKVVEVSVMINRDPQHVHSGTVGAPFAALAEFPTEAFTAQDCPFCKKGIAINTEVGHGRVYLKKRGK